MRAADPRTNCWFTTYSGQYARIYTNTAMQTAGIRSPPGATARRRNRLPAYCGVQEVYSSTNWVYVRSTGLGSYNDGAVVFERAAHATISQFAGEPKNTLPLSAHDQRADDENRQRWRPDWCISWTAWRCSTVGTPILGSGRRGCPKRQHRLLESRRLCQRRRDVRCRQRASAEYGLYHYHADPLALRYQLGDHVDFNATTKTYTKTPTRRRNIRRFSRGWRTAFRFTGLTAIPIATNANSGIRRMVSGYVLRNGQNGTDNLSTNGAARTTIPAWAERLYGIVRQPKRTDGFESTIRLAVIWRTTIISAI